MGSVIYTNRFQDSRTAEGFINVCSDITTKALKAAGCGQYGESAVYWNRAATLAPTYGFQESCRLNAILMLEKLKPSVDGIDVEWEEWGEAIDYADTPLPEERHEG